MPLSGTDRSNPSGRTGQWSAASPAGQPGPALFTLHNVGFGHSGRPSLFASLNLDIPAGTLLLLRGPSGGGKSTLLRLLCRLEEPDAGEIRFDGRPLPEWPPAHLRRQAVYVHQEPSLVDGSVAGNLLVPFGLAANKDLPRPDKPARTAALRELGLDVDQERDVAALSGGQRLRICLARALLLKPRALLLDEPTAALDEASATLVRQAIQTRVENGLTVVVASHDPNPRAWGGQYTVLDVGRKPEGNA